MDRRGTVGMSAQPYAGLLERLHDADRNSVQRTLGSGIFGEAAEAISSLLNALTSLSRKYAAAEMALDYAHSEGFEWPSDPFGEVALAFADPTTVPEYAALNSDASTQTVGGE
jgi:hypothetical protein